MELTPRGLDAIIYKIKYLLIILEIAGLLEASQISEEGNLFFFIFT